MSDDFTILCFRDLKKEISEYEHRINEQIRIDNGEIVFYVHGEYSIDLKRCKTSADILEWVHHLLGKSWMTIELIERFIELAAGYHKLNIYQMDLTKKIKVNPERAKMSQKLRFRILKRDKYKCVLCGRTADDEIKLHVDHIVSISNGGMTTDDNLRTLCNECNHGKAAE